MDKTIEEMTVVELEALHASHLARAEETNLKSRLEKRSVTAEEQADIDEAIAAADAVLEPLKLARNFDAIESRKASQKVQVEKKVWAAPIDHSRNARIYNEATNLWACRNLKVRGSKRPTYDQMQMAASVGIDLDSPVLNIELSSRSDMGKGTAHLGKELVAETLSDQVQQKLYGISEFRNSLTVKQTPTGKYRTVKFQNSTTNGGSQNLADIKAEHAPATSTSFYTSDLVIDTFKFTKTANVSHEGLNDASAPFDLGGLVGGGLLDAAVQSAEYQGWNGNNTGAPNGMKNWLSNAGVMAADDDVDFKEELLPLVYKYKGNLNDAVLLCNPLWKQKLHFITENDTKDEVMTFPTKFMNIIPIATSIYMPAPGDPGSVSFALVDRTKAYWVEASSVLVDFSDDSGDVFDNYQRKFRVIYRMGLDFAGFAADSALALYTPT